MRKVYDGAKNPRTGERVYWGFERGSEAGVNLQWDSKIGPGGKVIVQDNMINWSDRYNRAHPDGVGFDFDRDVALVNRDLHGMLNYTDPKLRRFQRAGGKVLIYHGWADSLVPAGGTPAYYERIAAANGGYDRTQNFARLFMFPGMAHCRGGAGPDQFDALAALEAWVERGEAPDRLVATKAAADGRPAMSRPACPWPSVARWAGQGSTNDAANFTCVRPA
jgi:feruloyl esterase